MLEATGVAQRQGISDDSPESEQVGLVTAQSVEYHGRIACRCGAIFMRQAVPFDQVPQYPSYWIPGQEPGPQWMAAQCTECKATK